MGPEYYSFIAEKLIGVSIVCIGMFGLLIIFRIFYFDDPDDIVKFDFDSILVGLFIGMPLILSLLLGRYYINDIRAKYEKIEQIEERIERLETSGFMIWDSTAELNLDDSISPGDMEF